MPELRFCGQGRALDLFLSAQRFARTASPATLLTCAFTGEALHRRTPSRSRPEILDARMTLEAGISTCRTSPVRAARTGSIGTGRDSGTCVPLRLPGGDASCHLGLTLLEAESAALTSRRTRRRALKPSDCYYLAALIPVRYHGCMAMTLRLPDDLDAKLTERARREGRSKQELAIEAIRDAQNRAELKVDDVLAELMDSDAEILDYLK